MNRIFDCNDLSVDVKGFDDYTGKDDWYAVFTVQLGELIEKGIFDWTMPELDWKSAAYNDEQYNRLCNYFVDRFYYREISIEPFAEWARTLKRKIVFEIMPKYKPLYERFDEGINPLSDSNRYHKSRSIDSSYPETQLSKNADYITEGNDFEEQDIVEGNFVDMVGNYSSNFEQLDQLILDELESMFVCMYTLNINATW